MPKIPQPIPYQGSKRQIAAEILKHFPSSIIRLVEPFCGSAALSIAVASRDSEPQFWINDAHAPLISLWKEIIFDPEKISAKYTFLWNDQLGRERPYFNDVRDRFNKEQDPADFLYLLARCVKAAVRYNKNGYFNNSPDNRRLGARPEEMRKRIFQASLLLQNRVELTSRDYKLILNDCTEEDVVYMDPPYQGVSDKHDHRYLPKVDHEEFWQELANLNGRGIKYAISYDGSSGSKHYGRTPPDFLNLTHLIINAGRSTQATLLGRSDVTYESLYLSPTLANSVDQISMSVSQQQELW